MAVVLLQVIDGLTALKNLVAIGIGGSQHRQLASDTARTVREVVVNVETRRGDEFVAADGVVGEIGRAGKIGGVVATLREG